MSPPLLPDTVAGPDIDTSPLHPDPAIAAALEFTPVPRKVNRPDGWTPNRQREFIRHLAVTGSPQDACLAMGKNVTGIEAVYKVPSAESFRAAWNLAVSLGRERRGLGGGPSHPAAAPGIARRSLRGRHSHEGPHSCGECGQVVEEVDEEREEHLEAMRSMRSKLLMCRRFYLACIAEEPRKRLAWELLVGPTDWERAGRMEPQDDEPIVDPDRAPYGLPNMRQAGMVLVTGSGLLPELTGGHDSLAELRAEFSGKRQLPRDPETDAMLAAIAAAREAHPEDDWD